jgi:hypothetical protein
MGQRVSASAKAATTESAEAEWPTSDDVIYFYGEECPFTRRAEPAVMCLEGAMRQKVARHEVWHDLDNRQLFDKVSASCVVCLWFFSS